MNSGGFRVSLTLRCDGTVFDGTAVAESLVDERVPIGVSPLAGRYLVSPLTPLAGRPLGASQAHPVVRWTRRSLFKEKKKTAGVLPNRQRAGNTPPTIWGGHTTLLPNKTLMLGSNAPAHAALQ